MSTGLSNNSSGDDPSISNTESLERDIEFLEESLGSGNDSNISNSEKLGEAIEFLDGHLSYRPTDLYDNVKHVVNGGMDLETVQDHLGSHVRGNLVFNWDSEEITARTDLYVGSDPREDLLEKVEEISENALGVEMSRDYPVVEASFELDEYSKDELLKGLKDFVYVSSAVDACYNPDASKEALDIFYSSGVEKGPEEIHHLT